MNKNTIMDNNDDNYISVYEYEKNVNPRLNSIPFYEKNIYESNYGIDIIDFSNLFNVSYKSTTPNLLASFIKLMEKDSIIELNNNQHIEFNATSHMFYVMKGHASIDIDNDCGKVIHSGDILITPCFYSVKIQNLGEEELQVYYINDSPLVNYLGTKAEKKIFTPFYISNAFYIIYYIILYYSIL